jgi:hypothetical protein
VLHAALLAAATAAGTAALPPRPPDATYTYTITLAEDAVGSSNVTIDGTTPGAIVVKENASRSLQRITAATTMRSGHRHRARSRTDPHPSRHGRR